MSHRENMEILLERKRALRNKLAKWEKCDHDLSDPFIRLALTVMRFDHDNRVFGLIYGNETINEGFEICRRDMKLKLAEQLEAMGWPGLPNEETEGGQS